MSKSEEHWNLSFGKTDCRFVLLLNGNLCPVKTRLALFFEATLEYLMANGYDLNWDCIWFTRMKKYNIPGMSRQVRYGRLRYHYMATAKVWVFDTTAGVFFAPQREPSWHIKKLGICIYGG